MNFRKAQPVRLVIADDHPIFRDGLRRLLEAEADLKVMGEAADGAEAVKRYLYEQHQVPLHKINIISYGKEKPFCTESNESCWQQNRRGHFVYQK